MNRLIVTIAVCFSLAGCANVAESQRLACEYLGLLSPEARQEARDLVTGGVPVLNCPEVEG